MGCYRPALYDVGTYGYYWSSSPNVGYADTASLLDIRSDRVRVYNFYSRSYAYVAGDHPDGSPWFK